MRRIVIALSAVWMVAASMPATAQLTDRVQVVDRLPTRAPDVTSGLEAQLVADVPGRRLYEVRPDSQAFQEVVLEAYDLDTLEHRGTVVVDEGSRQGTLDVPVDEVRHRVFVTYFKFPLLVEPETWMAVVDGETLEVQSRHSLEDVVRGGKIYALHYFAPEDKLYILSELLSPLISPGDSGTNTTVLTQWDVATGSVDWTYLVGSCQRPIGTNVSNGIPGALGRSFSSPTVYFACTVNSPVANYRFPGTPAVVRVNITQAADQSQTDAFTTETFPIGGEFYAAIFDPGSDRMFMVNKAFGSQGATAFDGRRDVFLGTIALDQAPAQIGLDPTTGRLAFVDGTEAGGLTIADGRATPLPQGLFFPGVRSGRGGVMPIDPVTRQYFVKFRPGDVDPERTGELPMYLVVRDRVPTFSPPPRPDPDTNTIDAPEEEGVTSVNYATAAQAYGARSLSVGGLGALQDNLIGIELGFSIRQRLSGLDRLLPIHPRLGDPFFPSPGDRDMFFSQVEKASLTSGEASAKAIASNRDANTDGDLFKLSHPSGPNPDPSDPNLTGDPQDLNPTDEELSWPYGSVECADFGDEPSSDDREEFGGRVLVRCDQRDETVSGEAEHGGTFPGAVAVTWTSAEASARRDPDLGSVATATAEAVGIRIGRLLRVGRVATVAEAHARGRPGTAVGSFAREVEGIWVADPADPERALFSCTVADQCRDRLDEASAAVNVASGGRISMFFPEPDARMIAGTPGGFEALVRKDTDQFLEDNATNNDDRFEVPGMVVVIFGDNHSRSREVLQFAGVEAEAHYGIFRLPAGAEFEPPPVLSQAAPAAPPPPRAAAISSSAAPQPDDTAAPVAAGVRTVLDRFADGFRVALSSPHQLLLAASVWMFLGAPVYLALRRRQVRDAIEGP